MGLIDHDRRCCQIPAGTVELVGLSLLGQLRNPGSGIQRTSPGHFAYGVCQVASCKLRRRYDRGTNERMESEANPRIASAGFRFRGVVIGCVIENACPNLANFIIRDHPQHPAASSQQPAGESSRGERVGSGDSVRIGVSGVTSQTGCCLPSLSSISPFPSTFRLLIPLYPCRRSSSSSFLEAARAREFDISQWIHHPTLTHRPPPIYNTSPFFFLYGRTESSSSSVLTSIHLTT